MSGKTKKKEKKHEEVEIEYITDEEKKPEAEEDELKVLQNKLKKREAENRNIKNEMEKLKDNLLRQLAEKENLRKRLEREKNDYYDYALSEFLKELLVILDNFERAIESEDEVNGKSLREGVKMIHKQYRDLLMKQGVKPIEIKENKFDPHLHQAFIIEESEDVKEPVVSEELQRGYMLHSRLLRPSLVKVMVPKKDKST
jgi:molecular chaperone GrpE